MATHDQHGHIGRMRRTRCGAASTHLSSCKQAWDDLPPYDRLENTKPVPVTARNQPRARSTNVDQLDIPAGPQLTITSAWAPLCMCTVRLSVSTLRFSGLADIAYRGSWEREKKEVNCKALYEACNMYLQHGTSLPDLRTYTSTAHAFARSK